MLKSMLDAVMERRARQLMEEVREWLPAGGPVLDLGSGTGHFSARLERELGLEVVTADVSDIHVVGPPPLLIADGVLPFAERTFSATLLFFMLAYPNDPAGVLAEATRVTTGPIILGFTHGDAMAENVLVDLEAGVAHWFDFETIHDASRPMAWGRADDVRALLVTCLVRTVPGRVAETLEFILDVYADEGVTCLLAASYTSALRRPLAFHLAQAGISFQCFREIARLLGERCSR